MLVIYIKLQLLEKHGVPFLMGVYKKRHDVDFSVMETSTAARL